MAANTTHASSAKSESPREQAERDAPGSEHLRGGVVEIRRTRRRRTRWWRSGRSTSLTGKKPRDGLARPDRRKSPSPERRPACFWSWRSRQLRWESLGHAPRKLRVADKARAQDPRIGVVRYRRRSRESRSRWSPRRASRNSRRSAEASRGQKPRCGPGSGFRSRGAPPRCAPPKGQAFVEGTRRGIRGRCRGRMRCGIAWRCSFRRCAAFAPAASRWRAGVGGTRRLRLLDGRVARGRTKRLLPALRDERKCGRRRRF